MNFIFGLGNPGLKYRKTRHNTGFMAADYLAEKYGVRFKNYPKLNAKIAFAVINGKNTGIVKPQTYMNNSGYAVSAVMDYYDADASDIIVIYDDIDIETGSVRVRARGSAGTHNGMRNIIEYLGSGEFVRIRVGIGKAPEYRTLTEHVLGKFAGDEIAAMDSAVKRAGDAAVAVLACGVEKAQSEYNG